MPTPLKQRLVSLADCDEENIIANGYHAAGADSGGVERS
jgi:hypothetical protein